jgi:ATP-binding cassette, subfamily B, bacterial MsbA
MTKKPPTRQNYGRLLKYLKPHIPLLTLSILLTVLYAVSNVYIMPLIRDISAQVTNKNLMYFSNQVINALLLYTIRLFSKHAQTYVMERISYRILINIRMDLFRKLQRLSLEFYGKMKMGDIIARVFSDSEKVRTAIMLNFESVLPNVLTIIGVSGYLFYLNWKLALTTVVGIPLFVWIISFFSQRMKRVSSQIQRKTADLTHILQETVSNIKIIQAFTMEERETAKFAKHNKRNFEAFMRETKIRTTQEPLISFLQFFVFMFVVWYGGYEVVMGNMTGAVLMSFFTGILLLVDPVIVLSKVYTKTYSAMASAERLFELLDEEVQVEDPKQPIILKAVKGEIRFENVNYAYNESNQDALNEIDVTAKPGEVLALVGLSGAGKSTFVNLILRFYDPQKGKVLLDGIDIRTIQLKELRKQMAIVPQEDILFRGTILENMRFGRPDANEKDVEAALKKANAWEFVSRFQDGVLTKLGDQGRNLSGGQKQRLSIARAILRDPKILILDEATSALDTESEKMVQDALNKLMKGRTTFIIAHRLSTIKHADRIICMGHGKILESGSHDELLKNNGQYAKLYDMQFKS